MKHHSFYKRPDTAKWYRKWRSTKEGRIKILYNGAKRRALRDGKEFNITIDYLYRILPDRCPIFDTKFIYKKEDNKINPCSPSLDRIDSSKGYTKDNVQIISFRANRLKQNISFDEIKRLYDWHRENRRR